MASPPPPRPVDPGSGVLYEVVAERVFIRAAPGLQARTCGTRTKGQVVEVFDWDSTRCWRRTLLARTMVEGWMLLDHPQLGPLARPKDVPFSVRPLEPLCVAAREGATEDLRRFVEEDAGQPRQRRLSEVQDVDGRGPLLVAAQEGHLNCCLLLMEGGARLSPQEVLSLPSTSACRALAEAVAGQHFEARHLDEGLAALSEEAQELADRLILASLAVLAPPPLLEDSEGKPSPSGDRGSAANGEEAVLGPQSGASQHVAHGVPEAAPEGAAASRGQRLEVQEPDVAVVDEPRGVLHEVVHKAVFIREEPDASAEKMTALKRGDLVDVVDYDATRLWGRVEVLRPQGLVIGWVTLEHSQFGTLLRPCNS